VPDPVSIPGHQATQTRSEGHALWRKRHHLLDTKSLTIGEIDLLIAEARVCKRVHAMISAPPLVLNNKVVANLFYENSTRTRSSFEMAAKKLGAHVINLDINTSSVGKGETIQDTAKALVGLGVNVIVQRHPSSGSAQSIAQHLGDSVHVINAGDGWNEHPTQALLDLFTMQEVSPKLAGKKITLVGDIKHSRVARSNIWLLQKMGLDIRLCGPPTLVPAQFAEIGCSIYDNLEEAVAGADFIMALRLQLERQEQGLIPSIGEYKKLYRLDHKRIRAASPSVRILHPGPVNKGVEITDELVEDEKYSLVSTQVTNGVAVRMALLCLLLGESSKQLLTVTR
jgi:aspartate carbamoyltransferase catalytic subunit